MEENIVSDPLNVGFFGTVGVMLEADGITDLIEECLRSGFH